MENEKGKKLPRHLECPVDNLFTDIASVLSPYFKKLNFSPNDITSLSTIFAILALKCLISHKYLLTGIFLLISYYFDCMDGYYARKYNMITKFGDKYDHYKDWSVETLIILILFLQKRIYGIILFSIKKICSSSMTGCQEYHYDKKGESEALGIAKIFSICKSKEDAEKILPYHRFCGIGTWYLIVLIYFIILEYTK
jgi:phosphatidylglycerophosphate synthase